MNPVLHRSQTCHIAWIASTIVVLGTILTADAGNAQLCQLDPAPSPADNPLKGLVPYVDPPLDRFPHSLEIQYLPLSDLMLGPQEFDWAPLESLLDRIAARGHQAVFRVWMECPGHKEGIPKFLRKDGLKVTEWLCTNTDPFPRQQVRTPDYADHRLHKALRTFILVLGEKYDGDPRIGFITAGLLETWGECLIEAGCRVGWSGPHARWRAREPSPGRQLRLDAPLGCRTLRVQCALVVLVRHVLLVVE